MAVRLDRPAPFNIDDPVEMEEFQKAVGQGTIVVFHPCVGEFFRWRVGGYSGGNIRLVTPGLSEINALMDKFGITDECPESIEAVE